MEAIYDESESKQKYFSNLISWYNHKEMITNNRNDRHRQQCRENTSKLLPPLSRLRSRTVFDSRIRIAGHWHDERSTLIRRVVIVRGKHSQAILKRCSQNTSKLKMMWKETHWIEIEMSDLMMGLESVSFVAVSTNGMRDPRAQRFE